MIEGLLRMRIALVLETSESIGDILLRPGLCWWQRV